MHNLKSFITYLFLLIISLPNTFSQEPFNCDYHAYLFQRNDVFAVDLASGSSYEVATDITAGNINATGYNPKDGYIWGSLSYPEKTIVRVGKNFSVDIYTIDALPTSNRYIGDVSYEGIYYLKAGNNTYYIIDLDPTSPSYLTSLGTGTLSQGIVVHDWAFNALDNLLYTVEKGTNKLYRIDITTGIVENLGEVPILSGLNYTYGAVYFDNMGNFYVSANQTGTVYIINEVTNLTNGSTINSNIFAFGPSSSSNDGARCPTAPVPMEDCSNGFDDDGDGLVDCDDPSCSGVASCPTIEAPTTSGNEGGLESNDRLSQQINKRNFNRIKSNYKFNKNKAKRISKSSSYGKNIKNKTITLNDFIPLGVIFEDEVIESSPKDLIAITNATDILSVDYQKSGETIASILAIKTEKGVYEHTKYICDRLLGAELLSVSTINIQGHNFIKSIIKNVDGGIEFVLSLSAKTETNGEEFSIDSHWNLDKYTKNVNYYNFQVWSNTVDNLALLGEEIIKLLNVKKTINSYSLSSPPPVFVRKGVYKNGQLNLDIVNVNASKNILFDAGFKQTETSELSQMSSTINLDKKYMTNVTVNTGNLFDIGFRIGDGTQTPDDLFLSDGPWGIDDAATSTQVALFNVNPNNKQVAIDEYAIERNIELKATTKEYISVYKAFTPRFKPMDISNYKSLQFQAKGTGKLEIRFIKNSINVWENQHVATVNLSPELANYNIPFENFTSPSENIVLFNDVVTIVFTMVSNDGLEKNKEITINELKLTNTTTLSSNSFTNSSDNNLKITPNPVRTKTMIYFTSNTSESSSFTLYNKLGQVILNKEILLKNGENKIPFSRDNFSSGIYLFNIKSSTLMLSGKLIIE
ncbi:conserved protein of unknown function precursor containing a type A C-terminal secretion signal [Tenacibaculum sp. 190524A02b]|uniref:DUF6923 family protein n=1 Tax=Tenacibaculum vairaonense TaxID=3137860 RepID=UPI0032B224C1